MEHVGAIVENSDGTDRGRLAVMAQAQRPAQNDPTAGWQDATRTDIETRLEDLLRRYADPDRPDVPSAPVMDGVVRQALESDAGGKRLRALLLLASYGMAASCLRPAVCGDPADARPGAVAGRSSRPSPVSRRTALDLACSIEIFQTGALIHDDIMDDSDERRGRPSAHRGLEAMITRFAAHPLAPAGARQSGIGLGIMLGDLLATLSLRVAQEALSPTARDGRLTDNPYARQAGLVDTVLARLLAMQQDVEVGQVLDEADSVVDLSDPAALARNCEAVYGRKTASYTCVAPLGLGFIAGSMETDEADRWAKGIGVPLGLAFQIGDDLKDIVPSRQATGKPLFGDLREGKRTLLLADALRLSGPDDRSELARLYLLPSRGADEVGRIRALISKSGAIQASFGRLADLRSQVTVLSDRLVRTLSRPACPDMDGEGRSACPAGPAVEPVDGLSADIACGPDMTGIWRQVIGSFFVTGSADRLD